MGSWLPEAVAFARDNQARLSQLPTAIFTVHLLNTGDDAASRAARQAYTAPARQFLTARAEAFFTGKLDSAQLGFLDRMLAKSANAGEGDRRDWSQVRGWAQTILASEACNEISISLQGAAAADLWAGARRGGLGPV